MNPSELAKLGAWIAATKDIPATALHAARLQLVNLVAAANASADISEINALLRDLPLGSGTSTNIITGEKLPPASAAYINACYSMAEDYDDIIWMGHTCHSAVFASLAVAEAEGRSFDDLLSAIVVANEVAGRLGAASLFGPLNGQMWTFIHLIGAAAATAWLLRLDAEQTTQALAISLSQPPYALQPAFFGPTSKLLTAAGPTQTGVMAAYLAKNGMTGASSILEDAFWKAFTFVPLLKMLDDLGKTWVIETLSIKTFPVCHYFQTACEATERLVAKIPPSPSPVKRVVCKTNLLSKEVTRLARQYAGSNPNLSPIGISFDLGLALAIVLQAGRLTPDEASPGWLAVHANEVRGWYEKVEIVHDPELSMQIVDSARNIPAGQASLHALGLFDWLRIAKGLRTLGVTIPLKEVFPWIGALLRRVFRRPKIWKDGDGIPLNFPNSVTIERTDGSKNTLTLDLPTGSFARKDMADRLKNKFVRALTPKLGVDGATKAFDASMAASSVPEFVQITL